MKKAIILFSILCLLLSMLCACGSSDASAASVASAAEATQASQASDTAAADDTASAAEAAVPAVVTATATAGDVEMDYCCFGTGSRIFVILPGLSIQPVTPSAEAIAQGFADFATDFTVYLFDRRSNLPETYTIEEMAEDTAAVMESLGLSHVSIFGASQGGMMAQVIALNHPELVDNLVLGSTLSRTNDTMKAVCGEWLELAKAGKGYELNEALCRAIYSEATMEAYSDALLAAGDSITDEDLSRFIVLASSLEDFDIYDRLGELQCNVLVLGCEGDQVTTLEGAQEIADALITGREGEQSSSEEIGSTYLCECYIYGPEYGHAVFDEAPDYRGRILEFLQNAE